MGRRQVNQPRIGRGDRRGVNPRAIHRNGPEPHLVALEQIGRALVAGILHHDLVALRGEQAQRQVERKLRAGEDYHLFRPYLHAAGAGDMFSNLGSQRRQPAGIAVLG